MTLNKISLPSNIEHPIIVRADFVIKALSWACLSQHSPLLILELDQSSILELRPSTYWVDPRRCFSYEIASPILAETKKVPCRCIGPQLGCIPTLDDLLERWKNLPYSFWPS